MEFENDRIDELENWFEDTFGNLDDYINILDEIDLDDGVTDDNWACGTLNLDDDYC